MQRWLPHQPKWSLLRRWPAGVSIASLLLVAAVSNPSQAHFEQSAHRIISNAAGYWPGTHPGLRASLPVCQKRLPQHQG